MSVEEDLRKQVDIFIDACSALSDWSALKKNYEKRFLMEASGCPTEAEYDDLAKLIHKHLLSNVFDEARLVVELRTRKIT